jgi:hypothetical protein
MTTEKPLSPVRYRHRNKCANCNHGDLWPTFAERILLDFQNSLLRRAGETW